MSEKNSLLCRCLSASTLTLSLHFFVCFLGEKNSEHDLLFSRKMYVFFSLSLSLCLNEGLKEI
jgi:hypothetical protein